jgi:hypothetical protein
MKRQIPFALVFIAGVFMVFQYFVPHESSEWVYEFLLDWMVIIGIFALALGIWSLFRVSIDKIKQRKPNWGYSYVTLAGLFAMILFGFSSRNGDAWGLFFVFLASALLAMAAVMQTMIAPGGSSEQKMSALASVVLIAIAVAVAVFDSSWSFHFYTQEGLQATMFRNFFDYVMMPILATMFSLLAFFISSAAYRAFRARNVLATLLLIAALIVMLRFFPYFPFGIGPYWAKTSNWLMNVPNLAAQRAIVIGIGLGIVATAMKVILGIERGYMGRG